MTYTGYQLAFLFFAYAFFGWLLETVVASAKGKSFANRGFLSLPFCLIYGVVGVLLAVVLVDLKQMPVFLFLGSALIATAAEWLCAKFLERLGRRRWWDYSGKRFHLDGYSCLSYSLLWGVLDGILSLMTVFHRSHQPA